MCPTNVGCILLFIPRIHSSRAFSAPAAGGCEEPVCWGWCSPGPQGTLGTGNACVYRSCPSSQGAHIVAIPGPLSPSENNRFRMWSSWSLKVGSSRWVRSSPTLDTNGPGVLGPWPKGEPAKAPLNPRERCSPVPGQAQGVCWDLPCLCRCLYGLCVQAVRSRTNGSVEL